MSGGGGINGEAAPGRDRGTGNGRETGEVPVGGEPLEGETRLLIGGGGSILGEGRDGSVISLTNKDQAGDEIMLGVQRLFGEFSFSWETIKIQGRKMSKIKEKEKVKKANFSLLFFYSILLFVYSS